MKRQLDTDDTDLSDCCKRTKETDTTTTTTTTTTITTTTTPDIFTIRSSEPFDGGEYRRTLTIPVYDGSMEIDEFCRSVHDSSNSHILDQDAYIDYLRDDTCASAAVASSENDQQQQQQQQQMMMKERDDALDDAIAEIEYLRDKIFNRESETKSLKEALSYAENNLQQQDAAAAAPAATAALHAQIQILTEQILERESETKSLKEALASKDVDLKILKETLDEANVEIGRLVANVRAKNRQFERIQRCHTDWLDRVMRVRDDQVRRSECELQRLRALLCYKNADIERLKSYFPKEQPEVGRDLCEVCLDGYQ